MDALGKLESTREAIASSNSYASLVLSKLPACIHQLDRRMLIMNQFLICDVNNGSGDNSLLFIAIYASKTGRAKTINRAKRNKQRQIMLKTPLPTEAVLWNAISRSNSSILDCTDMKSFLKSR